MEDFTVKKRNILILIILLFVFIIGGIVVFYNHNNKVNCSKDALKFKQNYEKYNGNMIKYNNKSYADERKIYARHFLFHSIRQENFPPCLNRRACSVLPNP